MNQAQVNRIWIQAQDVIPNWWDKACEAGDIIAEAKRQGVKQQITSELAAALVQQHRYLSDGWDMAGVQETLDILKIRTLLLDG